MMTCGIKGCGAAKKATKKKEPAKKEKKGKK
jgi:hypothetical protein